MEELFKYKIKAIHWLQEDANAETQQYQFNPGLREDVDLNSKAFAVFKQANDDLENVRKRQRPEYPDGGNKKKKSPRTTRKPIPMQSLNQAVILKKLIKLRF